MAKHAALSKLHDWQLVHEEQDIRGWPVHDASNSVVGRVDDLLVSTETEMVEVIRLEDGKEISAREIELGDGVVYVRGQRPDVQTESGPVVKVYDDAQVRRRDADDLPGGYSAYEDDFRNHYKTTYASAGQDYDYYAPAYRLGYTYGSDERYRGHEYDRVEPEIRTRYENDYGSGRWEQVREAVRHSFHRART